MSNSTSTKQVLHEHSRKEDYDISRPDAAPRVCQWKDEADYWASSCGEDWCFIDGGPAENRVRFCHGCGKPVEIVKRVGVVSDDDE